MSVISDITEKKDIMRVADHPDAKAFILHWGEMGTHWGVSRSVAQVHALLYLSESPLTAEDIVEMLALARSNVSTALKELQAYSIVRRVHVEGDRRDHFTAETDLWEMLLRIVAERKRREIDPTVAILGDLARRLAEDKTAPPHLRARIAGMHGFLHNLSGWYEQMRVLPTRTLVALIKLGGKVARLIPGGRTEG
jgi:DNA-binding transcriptional regulator GbsR (MarR family)